MTEIRFTPAFGPGTRCREAAIAFGAAFLGLAGLAVERVAAAGVDDPTLRYEEPRFLTGTIYDERSAEQDVLFRFERVATRTDGRLEVIGNYTSPDGSLAARERVLYHDDDLAAFELEDLQSGASGSARIILDPEDPDRNRIEFSYTAPGSNVAKERSERLRENTLVNDMLAPFLVSQWEQLMQGGEVNCRFIVVPRAETVAFTFRKQSETTLHGRPVVIIRMVPHNWLLRLIVKPVLITFEKEGSRRCLQYTGRITPKHKVGGEWKDVDAVTIFDWPPDALAPVK